MAGGFPLVPDVCNAVAYGGTGTSFPGGTNLFASATAHTKGSYTQITASTTADCSLLEIDLWARPAGTGLSGAVDIAIGAAASEQIILPNLSMWMGDNHSISRIQLPFCIPSGTRLSARAQTNGTAPTGTCAGVTVRTYEAAFQGLEGHGSVEVCGYLTATTLGTAITPSASAGVKGSWAQLIAATSYDYAGLFYLLDTQLSGVIGDSYHIDIGVGAGGSEVVIVPDIVYWAADTTYGNGGMFIPVNVPSGTRIAARCSASGASEPALGIAVYGVSL